MIGKFQKMKLVVALSAVFCLGAWMALTGAALAEESAWDRIQKNGTVLTGNSPDYPPFETIDDNGKVVGFDIDLIDAIVAEMGFKTEIRKMGFDSIIIAVKNGQVDIGMSSFSVTEERKNAVDFTIPYFISGQVLIARADSKFQSAADLKGKVVASGIGTTGEEAAMKMEGVTYKGLDDYTTAVMMLKNGAVDGVVMDIAIADGYVEKAGFVRVGDPLTYEETAIIVKKGNPSLVKALNAAIEKVKASGQLDTLRKKWGV